MDFNVKKAVREKIFTKIALMAPSGGGKTYGSLRLATGMAKEIEKMTGKPAKILLINTEGKRGYYYANEFDYDIVDMVAPHKPENYVGAINFAEKQGYAIVILDSSSHEWEGKGGCLDIHRQAGGRYQDWGKVTPRHDAFINTIADSEIHVIATMRGKDQYVMSQEGKKTSVEKVGVGAKQREGFEYEFTCTFLIDQKTSTSTAQKDNTHIFEDEGAVLLSEDHGERIIQWANSGSANYTPSARKQMQLAEKKKADNNEILDTKIKEIAILAKAKAIINKQAVTDAVKKHNINNGKPSANYNAITDINVAENVLTELNKIQKEEK